MEDLEIRKYRDSDFGDVARFVAAIQDHERSSCPVLKRGDDVARHYAQYIIAAARDNGGAVFIAVSGDRSVGMICGWPEEDDDMLLQDGARRHLYISDIFVESGIRRKSCGSKLLEVFEEEFPELRKVRVCSKASNADALSFYQRCGFEAYEVIFEKEVSR